MKNLNLVHLNGLRAVEAVGRLGSLQAAAEELGVSPGAVSQHVIKAEAQLGRAVFERVSRGLVPTEFGVQFLVRLGEGFRTLSEAVATARLRDETVLTISVAPVFASRWLIHRIAKFSALHPEISLRIEATTERVDVGASDVDVAIRVGPGTWPGVRAEYLMPQEMFPVCAPALAAGLRSPADLARLPAVVDVNEAFTWERWLAAAGLDVPAPKARHLFSDASLCLDAAIAGQGVLLGWPVLASWALDAGRLVAPFPIRVATGMGYYFVTAFGEREPKKVVAFKTWVRDEMRESMASIEGWRQGAPEAIPVPAGGLPSSP
ncbi:LysR substrate-binding domain-containing protein [Rhizobiaceae bacterium n13]|uniref:LysR substrate-binding domain-containing protein n=1 Tax=Ferirhizobium litorale TaxID=2927786 RepID=A0AAE3U2X5_9HYPH|nr:LysR substrate-binding domain-containing protein [Fererhizobium litorale]MDI7861347.1 LysR substrate-binding domain-containing protein [Fererhizobium litorale]MDI7921494.1 LysR substrate-binding domain-containing protein [Fererhizobium litorale]